MKFDRCNFDVINAILLLFKTVRYATSGNYIEIIHK
jgi:hypothetical protein